MNREKILFFTLKRFVYIGFLGYFVPILFGYVLDSIFDFHLFDANLILGGATFFSATTFLFLGTHGLTKYGSGTVNPEMPPRKLVKEGIYGHIRHPIYLGWILALLSASLFYGSLSLLVIFVLLIFFIHIQSVKEEEELLKRFGKEYTEYKKKVPMWVPRFRLK